MAKTLSQWLHTSPVLASTIANGLLFPAGLSWSLGTAGGGVVVVVVVGGGVVVVVVVLLTGSLVVRPK